MDLLQRVLFISLALGLCTVTARAQDTNVLDTPLNQEDSSDTINSNNEANQSHVNGTQASEGTINDAGDQPTSTTTVTVAPADPATTTKVVPPTEATTTEEETIVTTPPTVTKPPVIKPPVTKPPPEPPETVSVERLVSWCWGWAHAHTLCTEPTRPQF